MINNKFYNLLLLFNNNYKISTKNKAIQLKVEIKYNHFFSLYDIIKPTRRKLL